jgi:anthranilate phosphoribosyltransferase
MPAVTRTLKKGGDTGKLDRAEVRAVTAAIAEGRAADVLSGAVLQQFRAMRKRKSMPAGGAASQNGKLPAHANQ